MLQSARAFVSSSWQPQLVLYCSGLCHGAMPHCVSHDLFASCEAAPLCPGTAKLSARTQLERDGVLPPDFSGARRRASSVRRWSLQLSRQRGEPGALHSHLGRQPSNPVTPGLLSLTQRLHPLPLGLLLTYPTGVHTLSHLRAYAGPPTPAAVRPGEVGSTTVRG